MFLKKKGPIDVPGGLILLPMFAAHPYNHFCTEYPPGPKNTFDLNLTSSLMPDNQQEVHTWPSSSCIYSDNSKRDLKIHYTGQRVS